jgi:hypothetical protein
LTIYQKIPRPPKLITNAPQSDKRPHRKRRSGSKTGRHNFGAREGAHRAKDARYARMATALTVREPACS